MAYSKRFKDQSSSARRIATSIDKLIEEMSNEALLINSAGISRADRDALVKAATILRRIGSDKAKAAKLEKSNEVKFEQLQLEATKSAKQIVASWPIPTRNLEKVAIILATTNGYSLERYLVNGITIWGREVEAKDWIETFNELLSDSLKDIINSAAYYSAKENKPINEVLNTALEKIAVLNNSPKAKTLAEKWAAKMNP